MREPLRPGDEGWEPEAPDASFSWELDAEIKTEDAVALIKAIVKWFLKNYEDPANSTPFCSAEGGYQYLCGWPYSAREEIVDNFHDELEAKFSADELEEIIGAAVDEIEERGMGVVEWAKILRADIPVLRAHPHRWGVGRVHQFDEARGRTLCGKTLAACPGERALGVEGEIDCRAGLRMRMARWAP
jgi:hypothetical protein